MQQRSLPGFDRKNVHSYTNFIMFKKETWCFSGIFNGWDGENPNNGSFDHLGILVCTKLTGTFTNIFHVIVFCMDHGPYHPSLIWPYYITGNLISFLFLNLMTGDLKGPGMPLTGNNSSWFFNFFASAPHSVTPSVLAHTPSQIYRPSHVRSKHTIQSGPI